jgi:hypothetical protein
VQQADTPEVEPQTPSVSSSEALEIRQAHAARLILQEAQKLAHTPPSLEQQLREWRDKAQRAVRGPVGQDNVTYFIF